MSETSRRRSCKGLLTAPLLAATLLGCAGYEEPDFPEIPPEPAPIVQDVGQAPPGALWHQDVVSVVEQGLGRFLSKVRVEAALDQGRFTGFRILELRPAQFWAGVDLQPGDVVTSVNGMPIQRDTEAYEAFQALKEAQRLDVDLLRNGEARRLSYRIIQQAGSTTIRAPQPKRPEG